MRRANAVSKRRENRKEALELDITSLLDILVILLVFLLKSFNASELTLDIVNKLDVPPSSSDKLGHRAPIIQVDKDKKVWMGHKVIGTINNESDTIDFLYKELKIRKAVDEKIAESEKMNKKKVAGLKDTVNIVLDKTLPYTVLRQVMNTSARAGYPGFKFIVRGNF